VQHQQHTLVIVQQHHATSWWLKGNCCGIQQHCVRIMLRRALGVIRVVLEFTLSQDIT